YNPTLGQSVIPTPGRGRWHIACCGVTIRRTGNPSFRLYHQRGYAIVDREVTIPRSGNPSFRPILFSSESLKIVLLQSHARAIRHSDVAAWLLPFETIMLQSHARAIRHSDWTSRKPRTKRK